MAKPKQIELTLKEREAFKDRINNSNLDGNDKDVILGLLDFNQWLQGTLLEKKISISRLRNMVFGEPKPSATSLKRKSNNVNKVDEVDALGNVIDVNFKDKNIDTDVIYPKKSKKLAYDDYQHIDTINVYHDKYKVGDYCPTSCGGRLYSSLPGNVIKVKGQSLASVTRYNIEKLRCNLCGFYTNAPMPDSVCPDKYDYRFKAQLCVLKYYLGLPFHRVESYQKMLGTPISDATQWQLVEQVADCVYPIFNKLLDMASDGHLAHLDDTHVKILSNIKDNKNIKIKNARKGVFTTGVISYVGNKSIYLYITGSNHAGENMASLLARRCKSKDAIMYMCDALSRNIPKGYDIDVIHCLAHGIRKFKEIESFYPGECGFVIDEIAKIYKVDAKAKQYNLSNNKRLLLHQKHSKPITDNLHIWLKDNIEKNMVEPNSSLGKAIRYMLKHWFYLTQFQRIPGAPLDNNVVEAALKLPIRIRKNSMFFKTKHGAFIGSMLLSIIKTCNAADINPVEYLGALQKNKNLVFKEPNRWLPWNYRNQGAQSANAA